MKKNDLYWWIAGLIVLILFFSGRGSVQAVSGDGPLVENVCPGDNVVVDMVAKYFTESDCAEAKNGANIFFAFMAFAFFAKIMKSFSKIGGGIK